MSGMQLYSPFSFGERVIIDGDASLIARIVQVSFKSDVAESEISFVHNAEIRRQWIENWRLSAAPTE